VPVVKDRPAVVHTKSNGNFTSRIDAGPSRSVFVDYRHSNLVLEKQLLTREKLDEILQPELLTQPRYVAGEKA